jgi:hypothetical protein
MRWLFLLLLVLNVGYLAWELNREHAQSAVPNTLPRGVERIVLLRELEPANLLDEEIAQGRAQAQVVTAGPAIADPVQAPVTEPAGKNTASLDQIKAKKADMQTAEVASAEIPAVEDGVRADRQADSEDVVSAAMPAEKPVQAPVAKPKDDLCYTLGPFREMKTLRLVTRKIRDYVIDASFRSREEQEQTMFRVLLKPVGSKQEARALTRELASKNIKDYFIITEGPSKNAISLGYFKSKTRAHRHANRVRKLGFDVITEPVFNTYTIYWLDYRIKADHEIPQQIFDEHLDKSSQRLNRSCS